MPIYIFEKSKHIYVYLKPPKTVNTILHSELVLILHISSIYMTMMNLAVFTHSSKFNIYANVSIFPQLITTCDTLCHR